MVMAWSVDRLGRSLQDLVGFLSELHALRIDLFRSVDRLGRSLQDLVGFLSELHALRIDLFLHQQGLDTTTPAGKALFQMMGVFVEFERAMIQERVRAGLKRARDEGKRLGRPPIFPRDEGIVEDEYRVIFVEAARHRIVERGARGSGRQFVRRTADQLDPRGVHLDHEHGRHAVVGDFRRQVLTEEIVTATLHRCLKIHIVEAFAESPRPSSGR
jgi:DNA invertase Pin-like site-specific DNA recombinase